MSYVPRSKERVWILAAIIRELVETDNELWQLFAEWSVSIGLLYLAYAGKMPGTAAGMSATVIMAIDFARIFEAYKNSELNANASESDA